MSLTGTPNFARQYRGGGRARKKSPLQRKTYRLNEIMELYPVSRTTVWRDRRAGKFRTKVVNGRVVADAAEVDGHYGFAPI